MTRATQRQAATRPRRQESPELPGNGRNRAVIEGVAPEVDAGRFAIKRSVGEEVTVEADIFTDSHDELSCVLLFRREEESEWHEVRMKPLGNDRWRASFLVTSLGSWRYTLHAWVDPFLSWHRDLRRREDDEDIALALMAGRSLIEMAALQTGGEDRRRLEYYAYTLGGDAPLAERRATALSDELVELMQRHAERRFVSEYGRELEVVVDRTLARFGSWYEFFPRSCGPAGTHSTFRECEGRIAYAASLGFDIVYIPPIHPVGRERRKGPNNTLVAGKTDPGSPWAIGSAEGGHKSINPELGTIEDFRWFRDRVAEHGMELAIDIAFQCAPDHPYVKQHPEWFRRRADGSIQYAENPPKKYQDIYPFDFESENWESLWQELESVFRFWIEEGVRIFRVDNPHTKSFPFWEWAIASLRKSHPDVIFLSEAFTRPRVMHRLAKLGFNQSYTYFAWRNTRHEIESYFEELTQGPGREYLRPNLWPNTPDILTEYLQIGGRAAFMSRFTLAATLGATYGIYGPAFELLEHRPLRPGSEEYLESEKYQTREWDLARNDSLRDYIALVNGIRRDNPALHHDWNLRFLQIDNADMIAYCKATPDLANVIIVVVNLDPRHTQVGWVELPLAELELDADQPFQVHDLLTGARYLWHGSRNYVSLDPNTGPAHIFRVRRRLRTERDFEYFL